MKRKKNAIWGRYPCCDLVNNAIRDILNGDSDRAISELLTAITKAGGYVHEDIAEDANAAHNRAWLGRLAPRNPCCDCEQSGMSITCRCDDRKKYEYELKKFKRDNWVMT